MANYGGTGVLTGSSYGDLSASNSFSIQKKMLPIALKLLTFSRFAQRDVKPLKDGLELRFRRYEKIDITGKDVPIAEGVTPNFENIQQNTLKVTLSRYGTYVNVTDLMLAVHTDPLLEQISSRLATMAGELKDFLDFKVFRAGTNVAYARSASSGTRGTVDQTISKQKGITNSSPGNASALLIQTAVRFLEGQDAMKLTEYLKASPNIATAPLRPAYIAVGHTDLRQDIENLPNFVKAEEYSDPSDRMEGEIGQCLGIRFILTTQAIPYASAGANSAVADDLKTTDGTNVDVYPLIIMAQDFGGTATLAGRDSLRPTVVLPKPGPGDPLGQRGTVSVDFYHGAILLQPNYHYIIECGASSLT